MVICATPDCGVPGRPFPACDLCRQRAYCQSHCLFSIDEPLRTQLQHALEHDRDTIVTIMNGESVSYDRLASAALICPPCKAQLQPLFDWLAKKYEQPQPDEENEDDEYMEYNTEFDSDMHTHQHDSLPHTDLISSSKLKCLPQLVVFDLDHCLWLPEMYTLDEIPTKTITGPLHNLGDGAVAAKSGRKEIRLFPDALKVLQAIHLNQYGSEIRIAAASSADTPHAVRVAHAAMSLLEIVPGVTMKEVFNRGFAKEFKGNIQIGRTYPLSSDKSKTHFPLLLKHTNIPYSQMLFFDDCNWGDNCGQVERICKGVVTRRTPHGLQTCDWNEALQDFSQKHDHQS